MSSLVRASGAIALALGAHAAVLHAQAVPASAPVPVGQPRTLQTGGLTRRYFLYLPSTWHRGRPVPLVLVFHGGGGRASGITPRTSFSRPPGREELGAPDPAALTRR